MKEEYFLGIDLGGKNKKTTGLCLLDQNQKIFLLKEVFGKDVLKNISPYLKKTKVVAIDAPLTLGRGKGKMRLFEKFLSTSLFRKERVNPLPPALMPQFHNFARNLVKKLEKRGYVLGLNLIEVFPTLVKKICKNKLLIKSALAKTENLESALLCAQLSFWHAKFQTRWLGYKDGFLFLPETSFWKKEWKRKFYQAWKEKNYLKYRHLATNLF